MSLFLFDSVMYLHAETSTFKDKHGRTTQRKVPYYTPPTT